MTKYPKLNRKVDLMISWFFKKLRDLFSSEIPDELVACEFECREVECLDEDFLTCSKCLQKAEDLKKVSQKNLALDNGEMN